MYDAVKILGGQSVNRMHGIIEVRMGNFLTKFHIFLSPNYVPLDYTNHSHVQKKLTAVRESLFGMKECTQDNYKSLLAKRTNERIQKIPNSIFGPTKPTSITIITLFVLSYQIPVLDTTKFYVSHQHHNPLHFLRLNFNSFSFDFYHPHICNSSTLIENHQENEENQSLKVEFSWRR